MKNELMNLTKKEKFALEALKAMLSNPNFSNLSANEIGQRVAALVKSTMSELNK